MMSIPLIAFFVLIAAGLWLHELSIKGALIFLAVWGIGLAGFGFLGIQRSFFVPVEVLLDIILILMIFGQDLHRL